MWIYFQRCQIGGEQTLDGGTEISQIALRINSFVLGQ